MLYDHRGTLPALLAQVKRALGGHMIQRLGLLAPGGTDEVILLQGGLCLNLPRHTYLVLVK